jgi:hypothetical protein
VRVNKILAWAWKHEEAMWYNQLVTVTNLNLYVYSISKSRKRMVLEVAKNPPIVDSSSLATNTSDATPRK